MSSNFTLEQEVLPRCVGEIRSRDGFIFRGYKTECKKDGVAKFREVWLSPSVWLKEIERKKKWHIKNRERKRQMDKKYRQRLSVKRKAKLYSKEYRAIKGEELLLKKRKYRMENKEKCAAAVRRWVQANRGRANFLHSQYRARQKAAITANDVARKAIIASIYQAAKRITEWTGIKMHVDHIVPLARGGSHTPDNLQILPARLNCSKKHKLGTVYAKWGHLHPGGLN